MAFQTRSRDPLLDSNMQAAIEKRGKELIGIALILVGLMVAAMLGSYTPEDPNWTVSTDAPVQNWLGRPGASVSFILITLFGKASWAMPLFLSAWGLRFVLHRGEDRVVWPLLLSVPWLLVVALHMETLNASTSWQQNYDFGLGGMVGYTFLGALLALLPVGLHFMVKIMSLLSAAGMLALGCVVLGFTWPEVKKGLNKVMVGLILGYGAVAALLGRGASSGLQAAMTYRKERAECVHDDGANTYAGTGDDPEMFEDYPQDTYAVESIEETPEAPAKGGLLSRVPGLIRRAAPAAPASEDVYAADQQYSGAEESDGGADGEDRISQKIANAVRIRRAADTPPELDPNLPLTKGRGQRPAPLIFNPAAAQGGLPAEPPLTAAQMPVPEESPLSWQTAEEDYVSQAPEARVQQEDASSGFDSAPQMLTPDHVPAETLPDATAPLQDAPQAPKTPGPRLTVDLPVAEPRKAVVEKPARKPVQPSTRAKAEAQPNLAFDDSSSDFELPPLNLLTNPVSIERHHLSDEALEENARMLETVLDDYGVKGEIVSVRPGPVVTMYELEPAPGLKASRVIGLADDIARSMSALSARVSTVPGRTVIGIELPNEKREKVVLREILSSRDFGDGNHALPLALGKDIGGDAMVANLAKMPHLLIAGTTGSGKSVAINTMILSLLYKLTPDECRLIMIDPKMLELSVYDGIPHLLSPVVTDPKKAVVALKWVVGEMEDRYRKMSKMGVRNIAGYNGRVKEALAKGEMFSRTVQTGFDDDTGEPVFETEEFEPKALPYIVVIVDEMADLMMVAGKEIEACIQRLAQMARASGIHLIMATQRPSVDVITGTIKANFPTRISFQVTSKVDSRTILGEMGAEQLLGMGDMLYMAGGAKITRCHGPFCSDEEVEEVVNHLKQFGPPDYVGSVLDGPDEDKADNIDAVLGLNTGGNTDTEDALYDTAVAIVTKDRKCSTSYIQRKLAIGYNKAARLVEQMEDEGVVSAANHVGKREILVPEQ
ncbi:MULTISPECIES: DNA translocase FtsK [unclassified Leisingera]|uniref:DNA translocase FtsK n=1 Tax=unclassified Leisingera TaxID=2614906 RepID=UPI00057FD420|nr:MULTISPECIES: DNA translocase FtsK [unclassified Leisingera]KIC27701.1 cell division protein FtsK [Leisingera sp. ANG-M6]KIC32740.1 cell division protein FtsK [Leisingera sp. ANG-S5]